MVMLLVVERFAGFANDSGELALCESGLVAYRYNALSDMLLTYLLPSHPATLQSVRAPIFEQFLPLAD